LNVFTRFKNQLDINLLRIRRDGWPLEIKRPAVFWNFAC